MKNTTDKPQSLKMRVNAYGGWLISYQGLIYAVKADTPRKALNKFKHELKGVTK